jgi:hypothetical protein
MKPLIGVLLFLALMQIVFDVLMVGNIVDGEAAYRIITFHGATVNADELQRCLTTTCTTTLK